MSVMSTFLRIIVVFVCVSSPMGSLSTESDSLCSLSRSLLESVNVQLIRPVEMTNNQTRLVVQEELWDIYTSLGSGNRTFAAGLDKADLVSLLASYSLSMYHYTDTLFSATDELSILGLRHLSNLYLEELHTLWFSVQNDSGRLAYHLVDLVERANNFVALHIDS